MKRLTWPPFPGLAGKLLAVCELERDACLAQIRARAASAASAAARGSTPRPGRARASAAASAHPGQPGRRPARSRAGGGVQRRGSLLPETGREEARGVRQARSSALKAARKPGSPLVPPKPNELDSATRIVILRAAFGT